MRYFLTQGLPKMLRGLWLGLLVLTLSACATGQQLPIHSFEFHAATDSPDVEVLDYRYGDSMQPGVRASESDKRIGRVHMGGGVTGAMLRGDSLYVKWRIKSTAQVYEDTVDLKKRMPRDITDHRIYFVIKGSQLFVYLITPEPNPPGWPTYTPPGHTHKKTLVLYP